MVEINFTKEAYNDIDEITVFIAKDSLKYAELTIGNILEKIEVIRNFPLSGKLVREYKKSKLREIVIGNYRFVYKIISTDRIDILAVHHAARDIRKRKLK